MTNPSPISLSDSALLAETVRAAGVERRATADLLALLGEVDRRRLYLGLGYSSLFTYCTQVLRLSEPAAYTRITAARATARWPVILSRLAAGEVTLTTVTLLARHLTDDNYTALLDAVQHKSKRDVEHFVACLDPQPDVRPVVRRLPAPAAAKPVIETTSLPMTEVEGVAASALMPPEPEAAVPPQLAHAVLPPPRSVVAPLCADRYVLKVTLSAAAHADLQHIRELLRHAVPTGDPAPIVARALAVLRQQLERTRQGATSRPKTAAHSGSNTSRHVPAAVKRAVCRRDEGRCAFVGTEGRCTATGFLEFHHVTPFACGGPTTAENLELRCRAHNAYEAERAFGGRVVRRGRGDGPAAHERELRPDRAALTRSHGPRGSLSQSDGGLQYATPTRGRRVRHIKRAPSSSRSQDARTSA